MLLIDALKPFGSADASCAQESLDPEWWFDEEMTEVAKAICNSCPIVNECLRFAIQEGIKDGVWGGLTPSERGILGRSGKMNRRKATKNEQ